MQLISGLRDCSNPLSRLIIIFKSFCTIHSCILSWFNANCILYCVIGISDIQGSSSCCTRQTRVEVEWTTVNHHSSYYWSGELYIEYVIVLLAVSQVSQLDIPIFMCTTYTCRRHECYLHDWVILLPHTLLILVYTHSGCAFVTYINWLYITHNHYQVSVIKARVADELGMPTGKQKLQVGVSVKWLSV